MTMRVVAKFYPLNDGEVVKAKGALEQFKSDALAPRGAYVDGLTVTETFETGKDSILPGVPQDARETRKVVKIDGWLHLDK